jgi:pSer/pThr/pTyr-binding forkhead associated (FHA) protein
MALTLRLLDGDEPIEASSLTLDAPRIVIGRAKSCDVQLLDPTVSARHACIRLSGAGGVIVDEGSTNGIAVGPVRLPPHTPRVVGDGERVRIGRVWLELRFAAGMASPPKRAQAVALEHLRGQLVAEGEDVAARLEVLEGPGRGTRAALPEDGDLVIGRAQDADLRLEDANLSRRHVAVSRSGEGFAVRDLGSKSGALLEGEPLSAEPTPWKPGERLEVGETVITLVDPLPEAAEEARSAADVRMKRVDLEAPPPGSDALVVAAPEEKAPDDEGEPLALQLRQPEEFEPEPSGRWLATIDVMVALVALALLAASGFGLMYVLG